MRSGDQQQVRTEDDLRAALVTLERRAPSAETVLRAVHDRAGRRRGPGLTRALRATGSARWPRIALGVVAAAAAAALALALLAGSTPAHHGGPADRAVVLPRIESRTGLPPATAVGKAMLTAFSATSGDILYATETGTNRGVLTDVYRSWSWPAQPVTGQQERWRDAYWGRISATAPLKLTQDLGFVYRTPPASWSNAYGQVTVVCYAGGPNTCRWDSKRTDTPPGTWSLHQGWFGNPNPGLDDLRPAALAWEISKGLWRVAGFTHVNGQPAIELAETPAGHYMPLPTFLWVNARSHLPLRMIQGAGKLIWAQFDWHFLRPTPASSALLRVPIPAGYQRSGAPQG